MQPRQLLIVLVAALVVFGAAFGIAKAGGGDESSKASAGIKPAAVIEVGDASVSARVADSGELPALQLPEKTPDATDDPPASTAGPVATSTPPPTTTTPPPTTTTAPSSSGTTTQPEASDPPTSTGGGGD